jgi:hypothetical protein
MPPRRPQTAAGDRSASRNPQLASTLSPYAVRAQGACCCTHALPQCCLWSVQQHVARLASRRSSSVGPSSTRMRGCMMAEARPASCMRGSMRRIDRSPARRTSTGVALAPAARCCQLGS